MGIALPLAHLLEGLTYDGGAELDDEPLLSAIPRNSSGPSSPRSGCSQRASASNASIDRSRGEDGLVMDDDLVTLERAPQLDTELLPLTEALVETRLV